MQSRTRIFSELAGAHLRREMVCLPETATVSDMVARMAAARETCALITAAPDTPRAGRLVGIVTEQDVTRRIALRSDGAGPVSDVMSAPVRSIQSDDYLYVAIARMHRFGWRHMPVVDHRERPVGIIALDQALAVAAERSLGDIDRLAQEDSLDGLREVKAAQASLAGELLADGVPVPEILRVITHVNNDIHRRTLALNLAQMKEEGKGGPPVDFCLIIMGSGGRGENLLRPDQDNGFVLENYPDAHHTRIDGFFIDLAERMTRDLDGVGFPLCRGHVMATNPLWRKTRSQWAEQIGMWGKRRSTIAVQLSDIFFDFRGASGALWMAEELREAVSRMARRSPAFLRELNDEMARFGVALGWFNRFVTEKEKAKHLGEINLKHAGTLPLVSGLRLLALREGIAATPTLARIEALRAAGILEKDEADYLRGSFDHIMTLLLRQQLRDHASGDRAVSNYVHPNALSGREKVILKDSLKAIERFRKRIQHEFTAEIF